VRHDRVLEGRLSVGERDVIAKFDRLAPGFSEREYADPVAYYRRRARAVIENGPPLEPGDTVLDLGCGDGQAAGALLEHGLRYHGVDASPGMIAAAREALGDRARFDVGEIDAYVPPEPVAAVTCFRAIYYTSDRPAFFEHVRRFTRKKFLFDFSLHDFPRRLVVGELRAAGFRHVELRPFLAPQHYAPGPRLDALLHGLERAGPLLRPLMQVRFTYVVSATV
jgi:ubiquinone/menaquinone biosynthesis C-methylase UbiE